MKKTDYFLFYEMIAVFFILSFQPILGMISTLTDIGDAIYLMIYWSWIVLIFLFISLGILSLREK